jgi:uncharacterized glyoxalase superfamily protein PhnB
MLRNRSVPVDTVLPHVAYTNVDEAVRWLASTFGFVEHYRYGGPDNPDGAQVHSGDAWIQLHRARGDRGPSSITVFVEDIDAHYAHARAQGVKLSEELHETAYGELQYAALDLDGNHWIFSRHARDVDPAAWGATVATRLAAT